MDCELIYATIQTKGNSWDVARDFIIRTANHSIDCFEFTKWCHYNRLFLLIVFSPKECFDEKKFSEQNSYNLKN